MYAYTCHTNHCGYRWESKIWDDSCPLCQQKLTTFRKIIDTTTIDVVNHPLHYTNGKVECIDAIESALTPLEFQGFCKGQIIKYVWRANLKNGREDLEKAEWYLKKLLEKEK